MVQDLAQALERAQEETGAAARSVTSAAIDLEEVVTRTLDAAGALQGVDAVVVTVGAGGETLTAASGIRPSGPGQRDRGPPDGSQPRSIAVEYDYGPGVQPTRPRSVPRSRSRSRTTASSSAISRPTPFRPGCFRPSGTAELEELAHRAGPRSTMPAAFARRASSRTSTRSPASTTAATSTRRSPGRWRGRSAMAAAWRSSSSISTTSRRSTTGSATSPGTACWRGGRPGSRRVRSADVACRVGGDEFAVILPESSLHGRRSALRAARAGALGPAGRAGGAAASLRGRGRAAPGRRRDLVLRAGGRGPLPRQGRRQGNRGPGRGAYGAAATAARNGIQLVSGIAPDRRQTVARAADLVERAPAAARPRPCSARRAPRGGAPSRSPAGRARRRAARAASPGRPRRSHRRRGCRGAGRRRRWLRTRRPRARSDSPPAAGGAGPPVEARPRSRPARARCWRRPDAAPAGTASLPPKRRCTIARSAARVAPARSSRPAAGRAWRRGSSAPPPRHASRARAPRSRSS